MNISIKSNLDLNLESCADFLNSTAFDNFMNSKANESFTLNSDQMSLIQNSPHLATFTTNLPTITDLNLRNQNALKQITNENSSSRSSSESEIDESCKIKKNKQINPIKKRISKKKKNSKVQNFQVLTNENQIPSGLDVKKTRKKIQEYEFIQNSDYRRQVKYKRRLGIIKKVLIKIFNIN